MDDAQTRSQLRQVRILSPLGDDEIEALARAVSWREVKAGEEVVSHLAEGAEIFFVLEGRFEVRLLSPIGRHVLLRQLQCGSHFGELAALTGSPRSVSVSAETDGLIGECPREAFVAAMDANGVFARHVAAELARTVVHLTDKVFELAALEVRFRIYAELLRLARAGVATNEGVAIADAPTHEALAAAVGTQREAVTRELRALAAEGLLRQDRREIVIRDLERLRDLVRRRGGLTASQVVDWIF